MLFPQVLPLWTVSDLIHAVISVLSFGLLLVPSVSANYESYRRTSIIIGIIVPLTVILIVTIIFCCYLRQRRGKEVHNAQYPTSGTVPSQQPPYPTDGTPFPPRYSELGQVYPPPQPPYPQTSSMPVPAPPPYPSNIGTSQPTEPPPPPPTKY
ncbi:unnamed protein product [Dicrocoelium dendriticum]|nr:unnamed protein product [Dicrocoelium dendriticum]